MASRRNYLTQDELKDYADITITNTTEADDRISQAEAEIDAYVGFVKKFFCGEEVGIAQSGSASGIVMQSDRVNWDKNFFEGCEIEIIGGTGKGQRRTISANGYNNGAVSVSVAWTTPPDNTSFYKIYQLGKFPRREDVYYQSINTSEPTYYKSIPDMVKQAVAAQMQFHIQMGETYFSSNAANVQREKIDDYEVEYFSGSTGSQNKIVAPKAQELLRGYKVIVGDFYDR
jgi:hypothetical protein